MSGAPDAARRGDGHEGDARDPSRAARGGRQLRGREGFVEAVRERALGQDVLKGLDAGPAGRQDRPRGAHRADGRRRTRSSRSADRRPWCSSAACRARARRRRARSSRCTCASTKARRRRWSPPTCSARRDRPARAARTADPGARLPTETATRSPLARPASSGRRGQGCDVVIVDTAGRLHVDEELMTELERMRRQ